MSGGVVKQSPRDEAFTMLESFDDAFPGIMNAARSDGERRRLLVKRDELRAKVLSCINLDDELMNNNYAGQAFNELAAATRKLLKKQFAGGDEEAQLERERLRNIFETTCNQISADHYLESERAAKRARLMPVGDGGAAAPGDDSVDLTTDDE